MQTIARLFTRFFAFQPALYDGEFDVQTAGARRMTQLADDETDPANPIAYSYFGA